MDHITIPNIEKELTKILDHKPMTCDNLERFVLLSKAMKYLSHMHREFTQEDAEAWIAAMDPPARWTKDQTTVMMQHMGYKHTPCEFWAAMNAMYSDYGETMKKHGMDAPELWAEMAHDFIDDMDAEPDKIGRYWRDIVRHKE